MIIGIKNLLNSDNINVTSSVTAISGKNESQILTPDALKIWQVEQGAVILTFDFTSAIEVELISLFNVICETSVKIETFDGAAALIESKTILSSDLTGLDMLNTYFKLTDSTPIKKITLTYVGPTASFLTSTGFLWAGDLIDVGCLENLILRDATADALTTTRAQTASIKDEYNYQDYDITTKKDSGFDEFRDKMRLLIRAGLLLGRPFIFDVEPPFSIPEVLLATFDASRVQYDVIDTGEAPYLTQSTLGILEVFGCQ